MTEDLHGFRVIRHAALPSTSTEAARLLSAGSLPLPAVVVADVQTAGRGTRGRAWDGGTAPGDTLAATFCFGRLDVPAGQLALVVAVLVRRAVSRFDGGVMVKWPNDLMLNGRKLGGILCERLAGGDLVGVGLNLRPPPPHAGAATLDHVPEDAALAAVAGELAGLPRVRWPELRAEYGRHHLLTGRHVEVDGTVAGLCRGVDAEGRLLVDGRPPVVTGTVRLAEGAGPADC